MSDLEIRYPGPGGTQIRRVFEVESAIIDKWPGQDHCEVTFSPAPPGGQAIKFSHYGDVEKFAEGLRSQGIAVEVRLKCQQPGN